MKVDIQIEVSELKDGTFIVRLNGADIGELNNIDPLDELEVIYTLAELLYEQPHSGKSHNDLVKEIKEKLAKLLAWYSTE
jgi:hypothetical protein